MSFTSCEVWYSERNIVIAAIHWSQIRLRDFIWHCMIWFSSSTSLVGHDVHLLHVNGFLYFIRFLVDNRLWMNFCILTLSSIYIAFNAFEWGSHQIDDVVGSDHLYHPLTTITYLEPINMDDKQVEEAKAEKARFQALLETKEKKMTNQARDALQRSHHQTTNKTTTSSNHPNPTNQKKRKMC